MVDLKMANTCKHLAAIQCLMLIGMQPSLLASKTKLDGLPALPMWTHTVTSFFPYYPCPHSCCHPCPHSYPHPFPYLCSHSCPPSLLHSLLHSPCTRPCPSTSVSQGGWRRLRRLSPTSFYTPLAAPTLSHRLCPACSPSFCLHCLQLPSHSHRLYLQTLKIVNNLSVKLHGVMLGSS